EEDLVQRRGQAGTNRVQHLVKDRGTLLSKAARLGPAGRDLRGIEQGLGIAATPADEPRRDLGGKMEAGHLLLDMNRKALGQDGAEHRGADRPADLPPELDLARGNAQKVTRQRSLHGREVERKGCPEPGTDEDDVADDLEAG